MKSIHPTYHKEVTFKCACGSSFVAGATIEKFESELCNKCHPFYTGKQKIVDTSRRVEKFSKRLLQKSDSLVTKKVKKERSKTKKEERGAIAEKEQA